ncbi:hypothetical protein LH53_06085 [Mesotoga sp. TolDC]|nr:hypothetical protein LH53_06085 [Mesotoga sp. TolDC]
MPVALTEEQDSESRKKAEKCEAGEQRARRQYRFAAKYSLSSSAVILLADKDVESLFWKSSL